MPESAVAREAREEVSIWIATFISTACDCQMADLPRANQRFGEQVFQLTVSRLHDAVKHVAKSDESPQEIRRLDPELRFNWINEAINDARVLGLRTEGPDSEFVAISLDSARETIKWVFRRKGKDYLDAVERQAQKAAAFLQPS